MRSVPEYFYTQSAVIPFREQNGEFQVMLITSRKKKRWVIPKGVKEPELSAPASAANEAMEEAGIRGKEDDLSASLPLHGDIGCIGDTLTGLGPEQTAEAQICGGCQPDDGLHGVA